MNNKIIDGKTIAAEMKENLKYWINAYSEALKIRKPKLCIIQVGDNPASNIYVKNKIKACSEVGIETVCMKYNCDVEETELINTIKSFNEDNTVDGIFVQLPLPESLNETNITNAIDLKKDVDGFHPCNTGILISGSNLNRLSHSFPILLPCTPKGICKMLNEVPIQVSGKHCVIVGRSAIVGRPLAMMLLAKDATVTICHSKTENLKEICQQADILIMAIGKAKFITADYIKDGAVVIDVGINRDENGKLCGDVDFDNVLDKVAAITPVPGGVGPMTVAELLQNVMIAWRKNGR